MASIRVIVMLVLALTLGLALPVAAQPLTSADLATGVFGGGPFVEQLCESLIRRLLPRACFTDVEGVAGNNTALGGGALGSNTTGSENTAVGFDALQSNTTGNSNTATGLGALSANTTGGNNTATGLQALLINTTGNNNTATGLLALSTNTTGSNNTALGFFAGLQVTTGNNNIHIGNQGTLADTALIRIGTAGTQTATFIAGINGVNIGMGAPVLVNADGQLGTMMSAAGFKEGIEDLGEGSRRLLGLRPVRFRYQPQHDDPSRPVQYGLVAEEVAAVFPELVYPGPDGAPYSVRYHLLSVLLLNELQRQEREWRAEKVEAAARFEAQQAQLDELRSQVRALIGGRAAVRD
jgi:Chaperone of endosialidase